MESIKSLAAATARPGCCPKLGLFGGLFDLSAIECPGRLLVIGTDGVGTKLKVIFKIIFLDSSGWFLWFLNWSFFNKCMQSWCLIVSV